MIKRFAILLILFLLFAACAAAAGSGQKTENGLLYDFNKDDTVIITVYEGDSPVLEIPDTLDGRPVTFSASLESIGCRAFSGCESLTELALPAGLKTVDSFAFRFCSGLEKANLPAGTTDLHAKVFDKCKLLTVTVEPGSPAEQYCLENGYPVCHPDAD